MIKHSFYLIITVNTGVRTSSIVNIASSHRFTCVLISTQKHIMLILHPPTGLHVCSSPPRNISCQYCILPQVYMCAHLPLEIYHVNIASFRRFTRVLISTQKYIMLILHPPAGLHAVLISTQKYYILILHPPAGLHVCPSPPRNITC